MSLIAAVSDIMDAVHEPGPDHDWGMFNEPGPWNLDPSSIEWLTAADAARRHAAAQLPRLTKPGGWPPTRRMVTVVANLARALGPWWWRKRRDGYRDRSASRADLSHRLRVAAERLGPTYIKLGQIISSGDGLFPGELVGEFKRCRDQVPAERFEVVREIVEAELGRPIHDVFSSFQVTPTAAASIAQVHRATLVTGEEVVVKVQRPSVVHRVHDDLRVMAWLAPHLIGRIPVTSLANPPALVELFAETINEELDFRIEAANMLDIAKVLSELEQDQYVVPRPHPRLVTRRVLVMERLDGFNFDDVAGMKGAGVDTEAVVRTGMIAFMEGALIHGLFHGDLHGGNLFVLPDGRTALLDFGIVGRLGERRRLAFLRLMLSATTNDVRGQMAALRDLGALPDDTDLEAVIRDLGLDQPPVDPTTLSGEQIVTEMQRVVRALLGYGARMPKELMLYVKNLMFLDGAIARLAPDLDLLAEVANVSMVFATRHGERLSADLGVDPRTVELDLDGLKAGFGLDTSIERLSYRDLQERRALIQERMSVRTAD